MIALKAMLVAIVLTLSARVADANSEAALLGSVPSEVQPPTGQFVVALLETVCPGSVALSRTGPGCKNWDRPRPSGSVAPPHSVRGILLDHFLSAESNDALVSADRGETDPDRLGGTLFMTREAGVWKPLWYHGGTITDHCMKVRKDSGREVPVCESAYVMGGTKRATSTPYGYVPPGRPNKSCSAPTHSLGPIGCRRRR
jgi:hypothetical protein